MNGGDLIARVLEEQGVRFLFTLCGGHISPILVGAKKRAIRVIDVRDEVTAVFAADAVGRLTGVPGVAVVTAGPGLTNTVTAVKNAQLAQSPLVLLGGAPATLLKGRGALQDIDQLALLKPHVKWAASAGRFRDLVPLTEKAFRVARNGVPGPVFVECPVDLLYDEQVVRGWYTAGRGGSDTAGLTSLFRQWYLDRHMNRLFAGTDRSVPSRPTAPAVPQCDSRGVERAAAYVHRAERPVMLIGSQATLQPQCVEQLAEGVARLGVPVYLSGMARGLLNRDHPLYLRHRKKEALGEADLVILAGVPCDFRLQYGSQISRTATLISVNRSGKELNKNRRPKLGLVEDPATFLLQLATATAAEPRAQTGWLDRLRARDRERDEEIRRLSEQSTDHVNPLFLCRAIDRSLDSDSVLVLDGGDFVASASYITSPRQPLSFLDPGVFGTLGGGAGLAMGAKLCRPDAEVWILYGDGSAAYSLSEFDTFVRHGLPVVAVVGNDACWSQIARVQKEILEDDVGTLLRATDYDLVAQGYGGKGFRIERPDEVERVLSQAKAEARNGVPVLVNVMIGATDFRSGSIAM